MKENNFIDFHQLFARTNAECIKIHERLLGFYCFGDGERNFQQTVTRFGIYDLNRDWVQKILKSILVERKCCVGLENKISLYCKKFLNAPQKNSAPLRAIIVVIIRQHRGTFFYDIKGGIRIKQNCHWVWRENLYFCRAHKEIIFLMVMSL